MQAQSWLIHTSAPHTLIKQYYQSKQEISFHFGLSHLLVKKKTVCQNQFLADFRSFHQNFKSEDDYIRLQITLEL